MFRLAVFPRSANGGNANHPHAHQHHEREHYQRHEYRREVLHLIPSFRSAATGAAGDRLGRSTRTPAVPRQSSTCGMGTEVNLPTQVAGARQGAGRAEGGIDFKDQALQEARLAEADPTPGRCWNPWETARIHGVDTAGISLLRVRVWRFRRPRIPGAGGCLAPLRAPRQPSTLPLRSGEGWLRPPSIPRRPTLRRSSRAGRSPPVLRAGAS